MQHKIWMLAALALHSLSKPTGRLLAYCVRLSHGVALLHLRLMVSHLLLQSLVGFAAIVVVLSLLEFSNV